MPPRPSSSSIVGTARENPAPDQLRSDLQEFAQWRHAYLRGDERGEAQTFLDRLFRAFGHGGWAEAGATLEHRIRNDRRTLSFADLLWKPRVLIEMKKSGEDLSRHYQQAFRYWTHAVPHRPRYVVLCNFDEFWIYDFDHQLDEPVDKVPLDDLPRRWEAFGFLLPEDNDPHFGNDLIAVTRQSAAGLAQLFNALVDRGQDRERARRFVLQAVMAMFAEDIGLLPTHTFTSAVQDCMGGQSAYDVLFGQFRAMDTPGTTAGGRFKGTPYFNGGLYSRVDPFDLDRDELGLLAESASTDWSQVRPEIFGTLFEQSMGSDERHAYGAHFTSPVDIARIVGPCIVEPWTERIDAAYNSIPDLQAALYDLSQQRILDPACGCGNFLYVAYREMRRLERRITARIEERRRGDRRGMLGLSIVSGDQFLGMDVNTFAVEVAKVTLMIAKQLSARELNDHLEVLPLDNLDTNLRVADALFSEWPKFDVCMGNPPYLGRRRLIEERGALYAAQLDARHPDVGGVSDYVSYWFKLAHDKMPPGGRAGLVGTDSIRQGQSREASLDHIVDNGGVIFDAVPTMPWSGEASVHVSVVNWSKTALGSVPARLWLSAGATRLDVSHINSSLRADLDLREAVPLAANREPKVCYQGQTPGHLGFVVTDSALAARFAGRDDNAVVHPFLTGDDLNSTGLPERWVIDFAAGDAALARQQAPLAFDHVRKAVLPHREKRARDEAEANDKILAERPRARVNWHHRNFLQRWWQLSYRRTDLLQALQGLDRYIGLSRYAVADRPSIYAFLDPSIRPADKVVAFAFSDDYSFGVLASSLHRLWFERRCTTLGQALSYTSSTVFDTFAWPQDPSEECVGRVADCAARILEHRASRVADGMSLMQQYDALRLPGTNPLRELHEELDSAVRAAYGFGPPEEDLAALLSLNKLVAAADAAGEFVRGPGPSGLRYTRTSNTRIVVTAAG